MPTDAEIIDQIERYASWMEARLGPLEVPAGGPVTVSSPTVSMAEQREVRRRWAVVLGAAAALVAVVTAVALWSRGPSPRDRTVPASEPSAIPEPSLPMPPSAESAPSTIPASTFPASTTPSSTVENPPTSAEPTTPETAVVTDPSLRVSAADPPPLYEPEVATAVELADGFAEAGWEVASNTTSIVIVDRAGSRAIVVDRATFAQRVVALPVIPFMVVLGEADVLYGGVQGGESGPELNLLAIPLSGDEEGTVVASQPIDINRYTHAPPETLGAGPDGIVERRTGETLMSYIPGDRAPVLPDGSAVTVPTASDDLLTIVDDDNRWTVQIERAPDAPNRYVTDSPPAPTQTGGATIWTWIGPQLETEPVDYGTPTVLVMATLHSDGSATWMRLPDDWFIVDSTIAGTVLGRQVGPRVELAIVPPPIDTRVDLVAADFEAATDLAEVRVAVDRNRQPRAATEQLIGAIIQSIEAQVDSCEVPRLISRLDPLTVRVTFGCDDATGGVDYRIVGVEGVGSFDVPLVERRQLCIRGSSEELCV